MVIKEHFLSTSVLLFITGEVAPAPPEKPEGVGAERPGGLGSILLVDNGAAISS